MSLEPFFYVQVKKDCVGGVGLLVLWGHVVDVERRVMKSKA